MDRKYTIDDLIRVAKRENNTKRSYLYVNPIQGKHIPVSPTLSLGLFFQMAEILEDHYKNEKILLIGFAETATAIGTAIAYKAKNVYYYMNTTRENVPVRSICFFTESHSHATEQRLEKNGLEVIIPGGPDLFAEDEVTTGNTIKLIRAIQGAFDCSGWKIWDHLDTEQYGRREDGRSSGRRIFPASICSGSRPGIGSKRRRIMIISRLRRRRKCLLRMAGSRAVRDAIEIINMKNW